MEVYISYVFSAPVPLGDSQDGGRDTSSKHEYGEGYFTVEGPINKQAIETLKNKIRALGSTRYYCEGPKLLCFIPL